MTTAENARDVSFTEWLQEHTEKARPLLTGSAIAHWEATATGKPEAYEALTQAELQVNRLYTDREDFAYLRSLREADAISDPLLKRQLDLSYNAYLSSQFDETLLERIITLSSHLGEHFNTFRPVVNGKELSDNDIEQILRHSKDIEERRLAWEGSKGIGNVVAADLIKLVKLRNEAAHQLGYSSYYDLALASGEQDETALFQLLDDLEKRTEEPFRHVKAEVDGHLAEHFGISVADLRPWHYEDRFFQEMPSAGTVDLDAYYQGQDIVELAARFYDDIGLPARDVISRSDLYGRPGKYQHAYCMDVDRQGDVRVMCSVVPSEHWMDTMLHELGHAVYDLGIGQEARLPYLLRTAAHTLTTEGIANLMGRFATNAAWLQRYVGLTEEQVAELGPRLRKRTRMSALIFARWCMVMTHFERALYRDPDQDLNQVWWSLVQRFQGITPPEGRNAPDWSTKIHLINSPVYYHNYLLGDLYAAQLHRAVVDRFYPGADPWTVTYADNRAVGEFLRRAVFQPGARWKWDQFVVESTGEPLSARAYAETYMPPSS